MFSDRRRPSHSANRLYDYSMIISGRTVDHLVQDLHQYRCHVSGWYGHPLIPGSFTYDSLLCGIMSVIETCDLRTASGHEIASAVHQGWVKNYKFWKKQLPWLPLGKSRYSRPVRPVADHRRDKCSELLYDTLPDDEKLKNYIIADWIVKNIK